MASNFKKSMIGAAVAVACAAPTLVFADYTATNIQFDRDGTGASAPITISGIDWSQGTVLAKGLITSTNDGGGVANHQGNNFTLYGQGALSKFSTPSGDVGMPNKVLNPSQELTYEFSAPMLNLATVSDPFVIPPGTIGNPLPIPVPAQVNATLNTASSATNFFKIWYSTGGGLTSDNQASGDFSGVAESKQGTGFGGTGTQADGCGGPSVVGTEILVMCGVIVSEPGLLGAKSNWSFTQSGEAFTALDAAGGGIDNYNGIADGNNVAPLGDVPDPLAIGSVSGTGSGNLLISVVYRNADFFGNTFFDKFVVDMKHTESSNLNFSNQTPHEVVVGQTWDVGTDTGAVNGGGPRVINNLKCLNNSTVTGTLTCDAVFEGDGGSTFQAYVVPEPGSLALLGLGMLGFGAAVRRRKTR